MLLLESITVVVRNTLPPYDVQNRYVFRCRANALFAIVPGCQKITNDGLTWSGIKYFTAVSIWQQWVSKG